MTDLPTPAIPEAVTRLTKPIIGIENRTAQEVFYIMSDRIRSALVPATSASLPTHWLNGAGQYITAEEKAAEPSPSYENEGQTGYLSRFSIPVFTEADTSVPEPSEADGLRKALETIVACFEAARVEGLADQLADTPTWAEGSLVDLVTRRLLPAEQEAQAALASRTPPVHPAPVGEAALRVITRARSVIGGLPEQLPDINALMKLRAAIADFDAAPAPVGERDKGLEEAAKVAEAEPTLLWDDSSGRQMAEIRKAHAAVIAMNIRALARSKPTKEGE